MPSLIYNLEGQPIELNYQIKGSKPKWLFIHGYLENLSMWNSIIDNHKIPSLSIDLPGHGASKAPTEYYTISDIADGIISILIKEKINSINIVGHSMGAYVSLELLNKIANKISSITIFQSTAYGDNEETKLNRNRAINILKQNKFLDIKPSILRLFASDYTNSVVIDKQLSISQKTTAHGMIGSLQAMRDRKNHFEVLKNFKGEINYYLGKKDSIFNLDLSVKEAGEVGAHRIEVDLISGHMAHLENPENVDKFFKELLNQG